MNDKMTNYEQRSPSESERSITKKYNKMISGVTESTRNKINVYSCHCGNNIKTIDLDNGTSPFVIKCDCGGFAKSSFYNDIIPNEKPHKEWYRPTLRQCLKMKSKTYLLDHILNGGLELRDIK